MTSEIETDLATLTVDDVFPRGDDDNPHNFSNVDLARRKVEVKKIHEDFPDVPILWCKWLWEMNELAEEGEMKRIAESGEWEIPGKFTRPPGGNVTEGCAVYTPEEWAIEREKILNQQRKEIEYKKEIKQAKKNKH